MTNIFISAPFFSKNQINKVKQVEQALANNPTVDSYYSPRLHQEGDGYPQFSPKWCRATYQHDVDHAIKADVDLEIMDFDKSDTDSGTAYEYGYVKAYQRFIAPKQFVTSISFDGYKQNLMLGVGTDHHFDNVAQIRKYDFNKRIKKPFNGKMH